MISTTKLIDKTDSAYHYPLLIKQLLHSAKTYHHGHEIVYGNKRYSYPQFFSRLDALAHALTHLGINAGDTIAVLDWDSHRYLECFFAIPMLGAILHTVNIRLSPQQILYTINHAKDDVIIIHSDFLALLEPYLADIQTVKQWLVINETSTKIQSPIQFVGEYEALITQYNNKPYDFPDFVEDSCATLFYTTGTTGDPKGVYFSHRQLVLHTLSASTAVASIAAQGRIDSNDVYMPITPMFHVHAWGMPYLATMLGMQQIYPGKYEPEKLLKLIETERVTFSHCVPTILQMLLQHPYSKQVNFLGWKLVIGGSALPQVLAEAAMDKDIEIYAGYGLSETCPILSLALLSPEQLKQPIEQQVKHRCKAGRPIPFVEVKIENEQQHLTNKVDTIGEIVVRSPWLTQGYLNNKQASANLWQQGYLHTGDIGFIDQDHYINITDRKKDVIKSGGEWISSLQLENLIGQHPRVHEVAVVAAPDPQWNERPAACIVTSEPLNLSLEEIKQWLQPFVKQGLISKWAIPDKIYFFKHIPKTSVGKIDKKQLRDDTKERHLNHTKELY